jgi:hypothetical protein
LTGIHGVTAPLAMLALGVLAVAATVAAALGRATQVLEWTRRVVLAVLVAEAAVGLALAVRGARPDEWIHWLYGVAIVVVLLLPGGLRRELSPRARSGALALSSAVAAALTWRLWASG